MHRLRQPPSLAPLLLALLLALAGSGCGGSDDGSADSAAVDQDTDDQSGEQTDDDATESTDGAAETTTDSESLPSTSTTSGPSADGSDLARWAGRYLWEESVDGDPGSNQVIVHQLVLLDVGPDVETGAGPGLGGRLTQDGFQTATAIDVVARPIDDGVAIEVASIVDGLTPLAVGDVAFTLTGDRTRPTTTLDALLPLVVDQPLEGSYFQPEPVGESNGEGSATPEVGIPSALWAIEAGSYDLIQIDVLTGQEIARVAGWGRELAEDPVGGGQALTSVEVGADGWIWADDCCEPAAGNLYGLDPERVTAIDELAGGVREDGAGLRATGLVPVASPDGSLLAYGNFTFDVTVIDQTGTAVASVLGDGDGTTFPLPLAWLDERTLVVAVSGPDGDLTITAWDLRDPGRPAPVGQPQVLIGSLVDAVAWNDSVLVVTRTGDDDDRQGTAVSFDGADPASVGVPAGLTIIDIDPSGRFLLVVGRDGLVRLADTTRGSIPADGPVLSEIPVVAASW